MLSKAFESLKMNKTLESLKANKTFDKALENLNVNLKVLANSELVKGIIDRSEAITQATLSEKEKLVDKLVDSLLRGQELGNNPTEVRSKVRAKLFEHESGDTLFLNNLKYINQILASSMPRSLSELTDFRETIAQKLVKDVQVNGGNQGRREKQHTSHPSRAQSNESHQKSDHSGKSNHARKEGNSNIEVAEREKAERNPRGPRTDRRPRPDRSAAQKSDRPQRPNIEKHTSEIETEHRNSKEVSNSNVDNGD